MELTIDDRVLYSGDRLHMEIIRAGQPPKVEEVFNYTVAPKMRVVPICSIKIGKEEELNDKH